MGETDALGKIVLIVGLLAVFGVAFFPWAGVPAPTYLNNVTFPVFDNPFDPQSLTFHDLLPTAPWDYAPAHPQSVTGTDHGCSVATPYQCVNDPSGPDDLATYVSIQRPGTFSFEVNLTNLGLSSGVAVGGIASISCRSIGDAVPIDATVSTAPSIAVHEDVVSSFGNPVCLPNLFQSLNIPLVTSTSQPFDLSGAGTLAFTIAIHWSGAPQPQPLGQLDISTIRVDLEVSGPVAACGGGFFFSDLGCQLAQLFSPVGKAILFVVNLVVYAGKWVLTVGLFLGGMAAILVFYFAIPGMPGPIQAAIDVILLSIMFTLIITMANLVRGRGAG